MYVQARRILLVALEVLGTLRKAVAPIGAQAIYQHVGRGDLQACAIHQPTAISRSTLARSTTNRSSQRHYWRRALLSPSSPEPGPASNVQIDLMGASGESGRSSGFIPVLRSELGSGGKPTIAKPLSEHYGNARP